MTMLAYLGHNAHPLPPVIESGNKGAIRRINFDTPMKPIDEPAAPEKPKKLTLAEKNMERQRKNRAALMMLINAGVKHGAKLAEIVGCCEATVWNNLHPMEKDGLIRINKKRMPFVVTPTKRGAAVKPEGIDIRNAA